MRTLVESPHINGIEYRFSSIEDSSDIYRWLEQHAERSGSFPSIINREVKVRFYEFGPEGNFQGIYVAERDSRLAVLSENMNFPEELKGVVIELYERERQQNDKRKKF